jgi:Cu/Zn superoxide dismutase
MFLMRSFAAVGVLALAACGGPEPRGQLSFTPRPELTSPPGEMATQRLVLMKTVTDAKDVKNIGSISLASEGPGVLVRVDFRGAPAGTFSLTMNEQNDCSAQENGDVTIPAGAAGAPWAPEGGAPFRIPDVTIPEDGSFRSEFLIKGVSISDTRGKSFVVNSGTNRLACGVSN